MMKEIKFTLTQRIEEVLEHYDHCLIANKGYDGDNKIIVETSLQILFRDITIRFGADRVSKVKGMVKVI